MSLVDIACCCYEKMHAGNMIIIRLFFFLLSVILSGNDCNNYIKIILNTTN